MPAAELVVTVRAGGELEFVYADELAGLLDAGAAVTRRASEVEPAPGGGWTADMNRSGGSLLGPYPTRAAALAAEHDWLRQHRGL